MKQTVYSKILVQYKLYFRNNINEINYNLDIKTQKIYLYIYILIYCKNKNTIQKYDTAFDR